VKSSWVTLEPVPNVSVGGDWSVHESAAGGVDIVVENRRGSTPIHVPSPFPGWGCDPGTSLYRATRSLGLVVRWDQHTRGGEYGATIAAISGGRERLWIIQGLSMATSTLRLQKRRNTPYCIWVRLHSELRGSGPSGSTALGIHPKTGAQRARKVIQRPGQSLVTSEDWSRFRG